MLALSFETVALVQPSTTGIKLEVNCIGQQGWERWEQGWERWEQGWERWKQKAERGVKCPPQNLLGEVALVEVCEGG